MFIDIWDTENKAIKVNEFSKDLINIETFNDALSKLVTDYGVVLKDNKVNPHYYQIYFYSEDDNCVWFKDTLKFLTLFDCFTFLISESFEYLFDSEQITFIEIRAGFKTMFKYDNRMED